MSSLLCKCGQHLSNSSTPNEIQFYVYSDKDWMGILENDTVNTWEIPLPKNDIWRCTNCERIYVFSDNGDVLKRYVLES